MLRLDANEMEIMLSDTVVKYENLTTDTVDIARQMTVCYYLFGLIVCM